MLPLSHKIAFLLFTLVTLAIAVPGFYRLFLRIRCGRTDIDQRMDQPLRRLWYALTTTLTQSRTFRKRPLISLFHSFIFYGFVFYILVNTVDLIEGYLPLEISSATALGAAYNLLADVLSFLVLVGVIALGLRRFLLPERRDFRFNASTLLHPKVKHGRIARDSAIVSIFILFHVGSRAIGAGAKVAGSTATGGSDKFQPFASALAHLFSPQSAESWRIFGYWGALGSVLAFLSYFPYSKHIHIFMAPVKYFFARNPNSGVLPLVDLNLRDVEDPESGDLESDESAESEEQQIGAKHLDDLAWPRLLDAYACIQCNRCQDVCPATATGKSLSPAALEINKRMELDSGAKQGQSTLLQAVISPEAVWACTTCGACMEVCPVQDEQMLDIIDIRRNLVMIEGDFPAQLQTAFRGMERTKNPWGINHDQRLAWAEGLNVPTTDDNPEPEVLYWVGCAASYDPQAQKTARAFVQLLTYAQVNYAVLGKKECCTGDTARRAGNEYLYRQLAVGNVSTLNTIKPKLVVASCPHCMNSLGNEYRQIGGDYKVMHHTQYLETLMQAGRLESAPLDASISYHDPCYLGRHNGVYDAPRNLLKVLGNEVLELERNRENAFCCGAGGAQFWKEEEQGSERISENRFKEVQRTLSAATSTKTLAVGCPFCKSMLASTPAKDTGDTIVIKDVAELLLEGVQKKKGGYPGAHPAVDTQSAVLHEAIAPVPAWHDAVGALPEAESEIDVPNLVAEIPASRSEEAIAPPSAAARVIEGTERKKWKPKTELRTQTTNSTTTDSNSRTLQPVESPVDRLVLPDDAARIDQSQSASGSILVAEPQATAPEPNAPARKKWAPKAAIAPAMTPPHDVPEIEAAQSVTGLPEESYPPANFPTENSEITPSETGGMANTNQLERKKWQPKRKPPVS